MDKEKAWIIIAVGVFVLGGIWIYSRTINSVSVAPQVAQPSTQGTQSPANTSSTSESAPPNTNKIVAPVDQANERITKKLFGTYVTPKNSPVSPEKFTGFHTGLDFETFPTEKDSDVVVKAICDGKLLEKRTASGYGGIAVQSCTINGEAVTVVYGHLRLSSIKVSAGNDLKPGSQIGVLGTGYSSETDGERKHLHLGIHIGTGENIKGYVQAQSELKGWMDPKTVLGL